MPNIAELVFQSRRRNPFTVAQQSFILPGVTTLPQSLYAGSRRRRGQHQQQ